jgi:hypothetical protein
MELLCHATSLGWPRESNYSHRLRTGRYELDSERNHTFCREQLKAESIIPAKRFTIRRSAFDPPECQKPVVKEHGLSASRMVVTGEREIPGDLRSFR